MRIGRCLIVYSRNTGKADATFRPWNKIAALCGIALHRLLAAEIEIADDADDGRVIDEVPFESASGDQRVVANHVNHTRDAVGLLMDELDRFAGEKLRRVAASR